MQAQNRPHTRYIANRKGLRCQLAPEPKVALFGFGDDDEDEDLSLVKLQIGVFGKVDDFQRQLDRVARLLDTDYDDALAEMVRETVLFINRNLEYCAYAASATFKTPDESEAELKFNEASLKERTKFKRETLSNFGGRLQADRLGSSSVPDVGLDKWLAITLLLVVDFDVDLPKIRSQADLRKTLTTLASLAPEDVVAAELLWTPQEEGDTYSKDELLLEYPGLLNL